MKIHTEIDTRVGYCSIQGIVSLYSYHDGPLINKQQPNPQEKLLFYHLIVYRLGLV
jgi:hypothetical protein